jgi:hypothetical protein
MMTAGERFLESLPEVSASMTQPLKPNAPDADQVKMLFDQIVIDVARAGDYAAIMNLYTTAQMYGRNGSLEHFINTLTEMFKKSAKQEHLHAIDLLCKNIMNTTTCINSLSNHKKEMLMVAFLGFTSSILIKNS